LRGERRAAILAAVATRCVLVDDNVGFMVAARRLLEREGLDVVGVASSIAEALTLVDELKPDFALVDVDLGSENGLDLAHALTGRAVPVEVILISAYAAKDLEEVLVGSPAVGFLPKAALSRAAIEDMRRGASENPGT
jgi:ActR/RegA family two-component response regulator